LNIINSELNYIMHIINERILSVDRDRSIALLLFIWKSINKDS